MFKNARSIMWLGLTNTWNQGSPVFFFLFLSVGLLHFLSSFIQTSCITSLAHMGGNMAIKSSGVLHFTVQAQEMVECDFSFSVPVSKFLKKDSSPTYIKCLILGESTVPGIIEVNGLDHNMAISIATVWIPSGMCKRSNKIISMHYKETEHFLKG